MVRITEPQLLRLQKTLKTDAAIGKKFGITRQAVHLWRRKFRVPCIPDKNKKRNDRIKALHRKGLSAAKIGKKVGLSFGQVYKILWK